MPRRTETLARFDIVVGENIRARRTLLGISQTVLADTIGVPFQQIQKYEKGINTVDSRSQITTGRTTWGQNTDYSTSPCRVTYFRHVRRGRGAKPADGSSTICRFGRFPASQRNHSIVPASLVNAVSISCGDTVTRCLLPTIVAIAGISS